MATATDRAARCCCTRRWRRRRRIPSIRTTSRCATSRPAPSSACRRLARADGQVDRCHSNACCPRHLALARSSRRSCLRRRSCRRRARPRALSCSRSGTAALGKSRRRAAARARAAGVLTVAAARASKARARAVCLPACRRPRQRPCMCTSSRSANSSARSPTSPRSSASPRPSAIQPAAQAGRLLPLPPAPTFLAHSNEPCKAPLRITPDEHRVNTKARCPIMLT